MPPGMGEETKGAEKGKLGLSSIEDRGEGDTSAGKKVFCLEDWRKRFWSFRKSKGMGRNAGNCRRRWFIEAGICPFGPSEDGDRISKGGRIRYGGEGGNHDARVSREETAQMLMEEQSDIGLKGIIPRTHCSQGKKALITS